MASQVLNENLEIGNTGYTLKNIANLNYGTLRFINFTISSSATSKSGQIPITTCGRPVYVACSGDLNPDGTSWCRLRLYRDGIQLRTQICQGNATSYNKGFCITYLDTPPAGHHIYKVTFEQGSGTSTFGEEGRIQAPVFVVTEV